MTKHPNYKYNVFVNCPFDDAYFELLKPLVYSIVYFGYIPRISLESSDSGLSRLDKIIQLIRESKYAIHDLSRLRSKKVNEYYRLNMPFELGLDYGLRKFDSAYSDKRSLILEKEAYDYMKALSDINGFDIKNHRDNPEKMIGCLRAWFTETVGLRELKTTSKFTPTLLISIKSCFFQK